MMLKITEKQILAFKAVIYGCNTNKRLIGAVFVSDIWSENKQEISFYDAIEIARDMLEQHMIDAVPVVRCKDCKHFRENIDRYGDAHMHCIKSNHIPKVEAEHFCSYGEREDKECE